MYFKKQIQTESRGINTNETKLRGPPVEEQGPKVKNGEVPKIIA